MTSRPMQENLVALMCFQWNRVLQIVFYTEFVLLSRGLGHLADTKGILQNQPTIVNPILIVSILLKCLLLLVMTALSPMPFI